MSQYVLVMVGQNGAADEVPLCLGVYVGECTVMVVKGGGETMLRDLVVVIVAADPLSVEEVDDEDDEDGGAGGFVLVIGGHELGCTVAQSVEKQPPGHGVTSAQSCEMVRSGTGDAGQPQGIEIVD
jgi:hypothetical protein